MHKVIIFNTFKFHNQYNQYKQVRFPLHFGIPGGNLEHEQRADGGFAVCTMDVDPGLMFHCMWSVTKT